MILKSIIPSLLLLILFCSNEKCITVYVEPAPEINSWKVCLAVKSEDTSHNIQFEYLDSDSTKDTLICKAIFKSEKYKKYRCIAPNFIKELDSDKIKEIQIKETSI
jgi:hypothetical protein